ncbi:MAG: MmcQ/YjbR family DNA-binding protein [Planctomycetota bacterium]
MAKKKAQRKAAAKRTAAKKGASKKASKKTATGKAAAKKPAPKKAASTGASAKRAPTRKSASTKARPKKAAAARKAPARGTKHAKGWVNPKADMIAFALSLPDAWEDHPWGETVTKVRKKVFAFFGVEGGLGAFGLCVKLPESADDVLELENAEPAGYGLGKSGWVVVRFQEGDDVPLEDVRGWIVESYRAVAPKTLLKEMELD